MEALNTEEQTKSFADGCHRWGWLIAIICTLAMNLVLFAYFQGTVSQGLSDMKERVGRLEQQIDRLLQR